MQIAKVSQVTSGRGQKRTQAAGITVRGEEAEFPTIGQPVCLRH